MSLITFLSKPNKIANPRINIMHVLLVIVYKDIVMYSNDQLERPMSKALAAPVAANFLTLLEHDKDTLIPLVKIVKMNRINAAKTNFIIMWQLTTRNGKWNPCGNKT